MKYACIKRFYDNGKITAKVVEMMDDESIDTYRECLKFDYYVDIFKTRKEAMEFCNQALKA